MDIETLRDARMFVYEWSQPATDYGVPFSHARRKFVLQRAESSFKRREAISRMYPNKYDAEQDAAIARFFARAIKLLDHKEGL